MTARTAHLTPQALSALMPMHVCVANDGTVLSAGRTFAKLCPAAAGEGARLEDVLTLPSTDEGTSPTGLDALAGRRVAVRLANPPGTMLRGIVQPFSDLSGFVLNLSFGIGAAEAVRMHDLTASDFAPTDLTVDLLYLAEAKAAVAAELGALNQRLKEARAAAEARAQTDPLTGLANRRAFDDALDQAISAARRGQPFVLAQIDLDRFKTVNDTLGHAAGDVVLTSVAAILRESSRKHDTLARLGGDEFAMILRGRTDPATVMRLAGRIIAAVEAPIAFGEHSCRVSCSIGLTHSNSYEKPSAKTMLSDADAALYEGKRAGRGRAGFHDPRVGRTA